ncbi:MAG: ABC-2 transporter permease, partial [Proteobacteria bacterium]|nr:ABC-2 transporter permease [Pseudomonadota bacterium]
MNAFAYLIRRETWENKALYRAPLITAVVLIFVVLLGLLNEVAAGSNLLMKIDMPHYLESGSAIMFGVLYGIIFMVGVFVAIFYLLDSLYAERKNRSILFWKSLPISDTETVLAKLMAATVLVPVVALISVVACWLI